MSVEYFEQHALWNQQPEKYQIQTRADVLSMIPEDVASILDAGCGDGFLTNDLPQDAFVIGTDLSREALHYLSRNPTQASVDFLPFASQSFDLVMVNDTIEHIPPANLEAVLADIRRVARKYILITVPYAEDVQAYQCKCAECGHVFHVNHHYRSLDVSDMEHIFGDAARLVEIRYSGDIVRRSFDSTTHIRHEFGEFASWQSALCPNCGSSAQLKPAHDSFLTRLLDGERSREWISQLWGSGPWNTRTEIIALYVVGQRELNLDELEIPCVEKSLLKINFRNPLQEASPDFVIGSPWAHFLCPAAAKITPDGMLVTPEPQSFVLVPIKMPVIPDVGDKLVLEVDGLDDMEIGIYGYDGLLWREMELTRRVLTNGPHQIECTLSESFALDRCGFPLYIYAYAPMVLRSMNYIPQGPRAEQIPRADFALLKPGHSIVRRRVDPYWVSWGIFTETEGEVPITLVPAEEYTKRDVLAGVEIKRNIVDEGFSYLLSNVNNTMAKLQNTQQELQNTREELQNTREELQNTREELQNTREELQNTREELQNTRQELQSTQQELAEVRYLLGYRTGIRGGVREILRSMKSILLRSR